MCSVRTIEAERLLIKLENPNLNFCLGRVELSPDKAKALSGLFLHRRGVNELSFIVGRDEPQYDPVAFQTEFSAFCLDPVVWESSVLNRWLE
jgi:hypothetical protein